MTDTEVEAVLTELAALEDPRMREVNERHGDDHGVNLTKLRGVAKSLGTDHGLALRLWATDDTAARLVALLICRPKSFDAAELDAMLRQARARKVHDWLVNYVVKKGRTRRSCGWPGSTIGIPSWRAPAGHSRPTMSSRAPSCWICPPSSARSTAR